MEFAYIVNPESGKKVKIDGKTGRRVLRNYLKQAKGGAIRSGSRMPSCGAYKTAVSQEGGGNCSLCGAKKTSKRTRASPRQIFWKIF